MTNLQARWLSMALGIAVFGTGGSESLAAESPSRMVSAPQAWTASYADLADLADHAPLVLRAKVKKAASLKAGEGGTARPGWARLYIEAVTENLLTGPAAVGEALKYLADVKLDAKGKVPKLNKPSVLLFASHVPGRPGEIRLVAPDAQLGGKADLVDGLLPILEQLVADDVASARPVSPDPAP